MAYQIMQAIARRIEHGIHEGKYSYDLLFDIYNIIDNEGDRILLSIQEAI